MKPPKYTYEFVKSKFEEHGYELVSKTYKKTSDQLQFICIKHRDKGIQLKRFDVLSNGHGCRFCGYEESHNKTRLSYSDVKKVFEDNDFTLLEAEYKK